MTARSDDRQRAEALIDHVVDEYQKGGRTLAEVRHELVSHVMWDFAEVRDEEYRLARELAKPRRLRGCL